VTQIIADRELMFSHLCQHRPDRMPKRVPAYASDADFGESRLDLPLEDGIYAKLANEAARHNCARASFFSSTCEESAIGAAFRGNEQAMDIDLAQRRLSGIVACFLL
jgi:hypothetical protein